MRFICICFLIMAMQPVFCFAQQVGSAQQGSSSYDLWLVRSQAITADLIKDSADLTPSERALLWARLAQRWWREDPEKARSWMLKPIEIVEAVPNKENPDERRQRLGTVRLLLKIVAPLDQKLSARLVAILTEDAEQEAKSAPTANTDGLIEAAIFLVDKDPPRAAELGAIALRVGRPTQIAWLIFRLRAKDPRLADTLLGQTIAVVRQSLDSALLYSLTEVAFTDSIYPGANSAAPRDDLRTEVLKLDVVYLQANPINAENRNSICMSISSFIAPVLVQFERFLPEQAVIARQSLNQCQSISPLARQRVDDALRDQPLNTVDDLLKAADDSQDAKVRTLYQYRAAALAKEKNDFDRALKILDSMSAESRELMGGSWEAYRWDWAATSALSHLKSGDVYGMRLVINAVPTDLQPFVKMAFVDRLPTNRDKETDPTLEFLNDARTGLRRSTVSNAEKASWYFGLLKLTVKFQPAYATDVLKETVAAINRVEETKDKNSGNYDPNNLDGSISENLPATLLEMDEYAVKEAVSSITSPDTRVQVRLELLGVCIQRMRSAKQATPKQGPSTPKGE